MTKGTRLSGRWRLRENWRGRMILQVEVQHVRIANKPPPAGTSAKEWRGYLLKHATTWSQWRDATQDEAKELGL